MQVSTSGVNVIKVFEGFRSKPYYDSVGVLTIGYGMTGAKIRGLNSVTEPQAAAMLKDLINQVYAPPVSNSLAAKGVSLNQNQFDALVSMAYNIGTGGLLGSTLYRNVVAGVRNKATITSNFAAWNKGTIGGRLVAIQGLTNRRAKEAELFFKASATVATPTKPTGTKAPVAKATGSEAIKVIQRELNLQCHANLKVDGYGGDLTLAACPIVREGAEGNITNWIQARIGMPVKWHTGNFLSETVKAVKEYQRAKHLTYIDAVVGEATWEQLLK